MPHSRAEPNASQVDNREMNISEQIDKHIADHNDWRGKFMAKIRQLIHEADPDITEEWKWGTPVFSHNGMVYAIGAFKDHIKINFFQGAALKDPDKLFNAGLDAKKTRAIDFQEGDKINERVLKSLILEAINYNVKGKYGVKENLERKKKT